MASLATLRHLQVTTRPPPVRAFASEVNADVDRVLMQALAPDPAHRPSLERLVRVLERAQARAVVDAGGQRGAANEVGRLRFLVVSLGVAAFGLWTKLRKRGDGAG
jgi:hypothetical protein